MYKRQVLLLDLFVIALDQRQDLVVGRVLLALQALNIAIAVSYTHLSSM